VSTPLSLRSPHL